MSTINIVLTAIIITTLAIELIIRFVVGKKLEEMDGIGNANIISETEEQNNILKGKC